MHSPACMTTRQAARRRTPFDQNVAATMIRHGNYAYQKQSIAWDPTIASDWPPFAPDAPPEAFDDANLARRPAGYRYLHGVDPQ